MKCRKIQLDANEFPDIICGFDSIRCFEMVSFDTWVPKPDGITFQVLQIVLQKQKSLIDLAT